VSSLIARLLPKKSRLICRDTLTFQEGDDFKRIVIRVLRLSLVRILLPPVPRPQGVYAVIPDDSERWIFVS